MERPPFHSLDSNEHNMKKEEPVVKAHKHHNLEPSKLEPAQKKKCLSVLQLVSEASQKENYRKLSTEIISKEITKSTAKIPLTK